MQNSQAFIFSQHPGDTNSITAQALKCSVEEVKAVLAGAAA